MLGVKFQLKNRNWWCLLNSELGSETEAAPMVLYP